MSYAVNLAMVDFDGYTRVDVRNPWDTTRTLHTYLLVPAAADMPAALPEGTVIRTPLKSSVIYSSVHNSLVVSLEPIVPFREYAMCSTSISRSLWSV